MEKSRISLDRSPNMATSKDLLSCGSGKGLHEKLLLNSKTHKSGSSLQTNKVPRSSVLGRLQCFLPQIAQANEKLREQMDSSPVGHFDIENVEGSGKVIEMDVALVELGDSESDTEGETPEDESSDSDSDPEEGDQVSEDNLRLPGNQKRKADITVLPSDSV